MSVTIASTRRWFTEQKDGAGLTIAKAFVVAYLYEYLTKDNDAASAEKINKFIQYYVDIIPDDPTLTADDGNGGRAPKQVKAARIPELRQIIKDKIGWSKKDGNPFLDGYAYKRLLDACRYMIIDPVGRQHFYNLIYHADEIVFETKDADHPDNSDTKGWINGAPPDDTAEMWAMMGDEGATLLKKIDWCVFTSLVSATGILSKGALDKSIAAGIVKPGDGQSYDTFLEAFDRVFLPKSKEAGAAWCDIRFTTWSTTRDLSGTNFIIPNVTVTSPVRQIALQYPLRASLVNKKNDQKEYPKIIKDEDNSTNNADGIPWALTEEAVELIDFALVTGKLRTVGDLKYYYPDGLDSAASSANKRQTAGSELGDISPANGLVRLLKEGFSYDGESTIQYIPPNDADSATPPGNMIMAGLANSPASGEGVVQAKRIWTGFSAANLQNHINGIIGQESWNTDGKQYRWEAQPVRVFKNTLFNDVIKPQMIPPAGVSSVDAGISYALPPSFDRGYAGAAFGGAVPQNVLEASKRLTTGTNLNADKEWKGTAKFSLIYYKDVSPDGVRWDVTVVRQINTRGPLKWGGMVETGKPPSPATWDDDNLFGNNTYYLEYNPTYEKPETSGLAMVSAYSARIVARIARCFPGLINRTLIEVIQNILEETVTKTAKKKEKDPFQPLPQPEVDVEGLKPYDLQCFLIQNIRNLTKAKDTEIQKRVDEGKGAYENLSVIVDLKNHEVVENPFVGPVSGPARGVQPGNMISYIHHGGPEQTQKVNALLSLCPDAYALLQPYIKIYRVDYKDDDTLVPYRETEIPFPTFIDPKDIEEITRGTLGRYGGAGIKSFSWKLDGVNPAEVENNITAMLQLRFQTLQDLFSLNQSLAAGGDAPGYLDLIIGSGTSFRSAPAEAPKANPRSSPGCTDFLSETYEGARFRIKAAVGWATPPGFANMPFRNFQKPMGASSQTYGQFLEQAIEESRVGLYLQVVGHELNFNEDGGVDLQVRYQAELDGILKAPNADIFMGGTEFDETLKELRQALKTSDEVDAEYIESHQDNTNEIDRLSKKREKKLEEMAKLTTKNKALKYKRFLCNLYDKSQIYMLRVPVDELRQRPEDMTATERAALANNRLDPNGNYVDIELSAQRASETDVGTLITSAEDAVNRAVQSQKKVKKLGDLNRSVIRSLRKDKKGIVKTEYLDVPYFYLGDLIDGVLSYLKNIVDLGSGVDGSFQMLLSNIEILDPLLAFKYPEVSVMCGDVDGQIVQRALADIDPLRFKNSHMLAFYTNIGSLPVSLEYFQEWFVNNIVRPQRETYTFINFLKQICNSLIGRAFNSKCFGDTLNFNLRFDTANFVLDKSFTSQIVSPDAVARSKFAAAQKASVAMNQDEGIYPVIPSLVLYSPNSRPSVSKSEIENIQNGIYTHYIGGSCGLSKKISFHKTDMPYMREARLQREGSLSALQLRELYNVNIDMVGNTLHRNGQYIKVDPTAIGVGSIESLGSISNAAQLLGIGGYYLISSVSHTISRSGFDVKVAGLQEGINLDTGTLVAIHEFEGKKTDPKTDPDS